MGAEILGTWKFQTVPVVGVRGRRSRPAPPLGRSGGALGPSRPPQWDDWIFRSLSWHENIHSIRVLDGRGALRIGWAEPAGSSLACKVIQTGCEGLTDQMSRANITPSPLLSGSVHRIYAGKSEARMSFDHGYALIVGSVPTRTGRRTTSLTRRSMPRRSLRCSRIRVTAATPTSRHPAPGRYRNPLQHPPRAWRACGEDDGALHRVVLLQRPWQQSWRSLLSAGSRHTVRRRPTDDRYAHL